TLADKARHELRHRLVIGDRQFSVERIMKQRSAIGAQAPRALLPGLACRAPATSRLAPAREHRSGNLERRMWPVQRGARLRHLVSAERGSMRLFRTLPARRSVTDPGTAGDQRWRLARARALDRCSNRLRVVTVDTRDRPARRSEPRELVVGAGKRRRAVDRNRIIIE